MLAIVIGDGPSRQPAEALVHHSKTVRFEGWKRDLGVYFSAADVVCLTSDNEGMPIALIEAALCGVPSVAANVGSTKEVVLDGLTGFVVKADDEAGRSRGRSKRIKRTNDDVIDSNPGKNNCPIGRSSRVVGRHG